jgi:hypothetical protein
VLAFIVIIIVFVEAVIIKIKKQKLGKTQSLIFKKISIQAKFLRIFTLSYYTERI